MVRHGGRGAATADDATTAATTAAATTSWQQLQSDGGTGGLRPHRILSQRGGERSQIRIV